MKAQIQKSCPFCKGKVTQRLGFAGVRLFECHQCGAMVSFNNKECNRNKAVAIRACLKNRKRRIFNQKQPSSASKILVIRKYYLRFSP